MSKIFFPEVVVSGTNRLSRSNFGNNNVTPKIKMLNRMGISSTRSYRPSGDVISLWLPTEEAKNRIQEFLKTLQSQDREDFYQEVLHASYKTILSNNIDHLAEVLEAWDATAEIALEEDTMNSIREAQEEFKHGEGIPWQPSTE